MELQIKKLREEAANLHSQAMAILNEYQGKALPKDKSEQADKLLDDVDAKIAEANRLEKAADQDQFLNRPATRLPAPKAGDSAVEGAADSPELKARKQAWEKHLRHGERAHAYLTADEETAYKALSANDDAGGGFLVAPEQFAAGLLKFVDDLVYIRQLATVEQLGQAQSLGVLSLDSDLSDWDWTVELSTGSEDAVKPFGKRALTPHPLAKRVKISKTLIRKSTRPIEQIVQQRVGYKLAVSQEKAYMTGDGAQKPLGLFTASADGIPTGRDVTYTDTDDETRSNSIIDAKYALKAQYQMSRTTRWIVSREFAKRVRKMRDGSKQFLWDPGLGLVRGEPGAPTLLDVPVLMSEHAPATFSSGAYIGLIGDLSFYWIVDALNMQLQVLSELYAETNQNGYIVRYEGDGAPMLGEAFARLKHA